MTTGSVGGYYVGKKKGEKSNNKQNQDSD